MDRKLLKQKGQHDVTAKHRELCVGDYVFIIGGKWLPGVIEHQTGPVSFLVKLTDGRERHWHLDQVVYVKVPPETPDVDLSPELPAASESELPVPIGNSSAISTEMLEVASTTPTAVSSQYVPKF